jgi:nicotinate (nicotinamide) nucleotide adenylyltransferase
MKIGLLGGSFNPVHNGHLKVAETVKQQINADEIWFLPTGNHPFKEGNFVLSFRKRYELIQDAISDNPHFFVKDYDASHGSFNYTAELMTKLYKKFPEHHFFFIIGEDNIFELSKWHRYDWLINNVDFVVVNRPITEKISVPDLPGRFHFVTMQPVPISSSEIRRKIASNQFIEGDVPENIRKKIIALYSINKENQMKEIKTTQAPKALGPYSQAIEKNGFVYLSGQLGIHPETNELTSDFKTQVEQTFSNCKAILAAAECAFANVVKVTVFLKDMNRFHDLNSLYQNYFSAPYPAREAIEVARLPRDADVEISMIAMK